MDYQAFIVMLFTVLSGARVCAFIFLLNFLLNFLHLF